METIFQPDMVLTRAIEVGIAIAGFTGIVIALSRPGSRAPSDEFYVSVLLLSSMASVCFSFLPMLLVIAGVAEERVWVTSSGAFLAYITLVLVYRARQVVGARPRITASVALGSTFLVVGTGLQVANVALLHEAWPYLVLVVAYVTYSFSVFVTLLWSVWHHE